MDQPLQDFNSGTENHSMLDAELTTELMKKRLSEALAHSKMKQVDLASKCAELAGLKCTPQAVNGWLKTGRVDKKWIRYIEQATGYSLGFSFATSSYSNRIETKFAQELEKNGIAFKRLTRSDVNEIPTEILRIHGVRTEYIPDFKVITPDGKTIFVDVKSAQLGRDSANLEAERKLAKESKQFRLLRVDDISSDESIEDFARSMLDQESVKKWTNVKNGMLLVQAVDRLADRINEIDNAEHRDLIASRLQTMAMAPDSMKSRNAVLESLAWSDAVKVDREQKANRATVSDKPSPQIANG